MLASAVATAADVDNKCNWRYRLVHSKWRRGEKGRYDADQYVFVCRENVRHIIELEPFTLNESNRCAD